MRTRGNLLAQLLILLPFVIGAGMGAGAFGEESKVQKVTSTIDVAAAKSQVATETAGQTAAKEPAQAKSAATQGAPQVLDPSQFFGDSQAAYEAAKEIPDVCAKLFCWCGCDHTDQHSSLLDCFTSDHGVDCEVCKQEALQALLMQKQGHSIAEMQQAIDEQNSKEYPFEDKSPALKKYLATRLWNPIKDKNNMGSKDQAAQAPANVLKPGRKAGDCCGGKEKPAH